MYRIKAPHAGYERKLFGVQFVKGEAVTEDEIAASWFSGRDGFTVDVLSEKPPKAEKPLKGAKPAKDGEQSKESADDGQSGAHSEDSEAAGT